MAVSSKWNVDSHEAPHMIIYSYLGIYNQWFPYAVVLSALFDIPALSLVCLSGMSQYSNK